MPRTSDDEQKNKIAGKEQRREEGNFAAGVSQLVRQVELVKNGIRVSRTRLPTECQGLLATFPLPMTVPGAKLQSPPCDRRTHRLLHTDNIDNAVLDTCRIAFLLHFLCLHCSVHDVVHAFTPLASWRVRRKRPRRGGTPSWQHNVQRGGPVN